MRANERRKAEDELSKLRNQISEVRKENASENSELKLSLQDAREKAQISDLGKIH